METTYQTDDIAKVIASKILTWPGVSSGPHRFGGVEFRVNNHEIGHLHGDRLADLPFPVRVRQELVAEGRAELHHIYPKSGWVSYYIHGSEDVPAVIGLFRRNYERWTKNGLHE